MIASGPAYPDQSTCAQAQEVAEKYQLPLSPQARALLQEETPKALDNVETVITGSVRELCAAAGAACRRLGYESVLLTDQLCCQAKEAGSFLASIARTHQGTKKSLAFLAGGTDGPTDAAGGLVDGSTKDRLEAAGLTIHQVLAENDAYHALDRVGGLIRTGPTGTNVNDVAVVLIKR